MNERLCREPEGRGAPPGDTGWYEEAVPYEASVYLCADLMVSRPPPCAHGELWQNPREGRRVSGGEGEKTRRKKGGDGEKASKEKRRMCDVFAPLLLTLFKTSGRLARCHSALRRGSEFACTTTTVQNVGWSGILPFTYPLKGLVARPLASLGTSSLLSSGQPA